MNNAQYTELCHCEGSRFRDIAESFGLEVAGPIDCAHRQCGNRQSGGAGQETEVNNMWVFEPFLTGPDRAVTLLAGVCASIMIARDTPATGVFRYLRFAILAVIALVLVLVVLR